MQVRIYKPAKTAMQSGQRNTKEWLLESEPAPKEIDPLMGWTSSRDTMQQVKLYFATLEEATAYAKKEGLALHRRAAACAARQAQGLRRQLRLQPHRPLDALSVRRGVLAFAGHGALVGVVEGAHDLGIEVGELEVLLARGLAQLLPHLEGDGEAAACSSPRWCAAAASGRRPSGPARQAPQIVWPILAIVAWSVMAPVISPQWGTVEAERGMMEPIQAPVAQGIRATAF